MTDCTRVDQALASCRPGHDLKLALPSMALPSGPSFQRDRSRSQLFSCPWLFEVRGKGYRCLPTKNQPNWKNGGGVNDGAEEGAPKKRIRVRVRDGDDRTSAQQRVVDMTGTHV